MSSEPSAHAVSTRSRGERRARDDLSVGPARQRRVRRERAADRRRARPRDRASSAGARRGERERRSASCPAALPSRTSACTRQCGALLGSAKPISITPPIARPRSTPNAAGVSWMSPIRSLPTARAIAAEVIERGHRNAVDEHARVSRRRAPHDDLGRARRRSRDRGQRLHDLRGIAAAGHRARELRVDLGLADRASARCR